VTDFDTQPNASGSGDEFPGVLVSRPDIARLAGVKRPAVTNWERRHGDFPAPVARDDDENVRGPEPEKFRAHQVLRWLSARNVPANALTPGEPAGTTYGDRFRAALSGDRSGRLLTAVDQLGRRDADRFRGRLRLPDYLRLLLFLVFYRIAEEEEWSEHLRRSVDALAHRVRTELPGGPDIRDEHGSVGEFSKAQLAAVVAYLDSNPPGSPEEGREAFDRLLGLLRDTDARAGAEFFTPPSVSRVMARALASHSPRGKRLHDPFCRSGELLSAYLDAAAVHGGEGQAPASAPQVTGRGPQEQDLWLARMNVTLHGAQVACFEPGPATPALNPGGPAGGFDAVVTNPPFGGKPTWPKSSRQPTYWRYGPSRTQESDWLQYVVSLLAPGGRAAVLMPAGIAFRAGAEQELRARMVEDGLVECVMALPSQLFELTAIKTHIWFLRAPRGRAEPVLFVSGEHLGRMASRTRRVLADGDIDVLVREYTAWSAQSDGGRTGWQAAYPNAPGLTRVVTPEEIATHEHRMDPTLYVQAPVVRSAAPDEVRNRLSRLSEEIGTLHAQARAAGLLVEERIRRYGL
jgi:type I restriction enzyme M protein